MKNCIAVILGGGRGTRLLPLTKHRAKPAVPLGGKYRLIDVSISNCLFAGIERIFVLTQFNSASLNRHIIRTYHFSEFSQGFVELLAAELSLENAWYQGTADAVRQNLKNFRFPDLEHYIVLHGDQLYKMDMRHLVQSHLNSNADITIGVIPISADLISRFGVMKIDDNRRVLDYYEKPDTDSKIEEMIGNRALLPEGLGNRLPVPFFWASMGIYVMKRHVLEKLLLDDKANSFEREILPKAMHEYEMKAFLFTGYWEDLGTIPSFFRANLAMIAAHPPINLYDNETTVYTRHRHLPPALLLNTKIDGAIIAEGARILNSTIKNSIVGIRSIIKSGVTIEDTILMGADYYSDVETSDPLKNKLPLGIGEGSRVRYAIIDKNVRMGRNVIVDNINRIEHADHEMYSIREGIVVIPKNTSIPSDTVIPFPS